MLISRAIHIENENLNLDKDAQESVPTHSACLRASFSVMSNSFMKYFSLTFLSIISFMACMESSEPTLERIPFKIPFLLCSSIPDSINNELFKREFMTGGGPYVAGKFNFQDTVDISNKSINELGSEKRMFDNSWRTNDSLDVNGFEVIPDYHQTIYYIPSSDTSNLGVYPVFIVNSTMSRKVFLGSDWNACGIQEAVNKENYSVWRAIECNGGDLFGDDTWSVIVNPQEFIVLLFPKYEGNYETDLRVRIRNGESVYVSKGFKGRIDQGQFRLHPDVKIIVNAESVFDFFLGASMTPTDTLKFQ